MAKILADLGNGDFAIEMACGHDGLYQNVARGRGDRAIMLAELAEVAKDECRACQVKRHRAERAERKGN